MITHTTYLCTKIEIAELPEYASLIHIFAFIFGHNAQCDKLFSKRRH